MLDYRHLKNMTDAVGMLQFSRGSKPDTESGYTLDDNARALIIALFRDDEYDMAARHTRFLRQSQRPDGSWCNLLVNNQYAACCNSEDSIGRALLSCGLGTWSKWQDIRNQCETMLLRNLSRSVAFRSPRAIAYTLLAICKCKYPDRYDNKMILRTHMAEILMSLFRQNRHRSWHWFEDYLTYCNGIIPHALFTYAMASGDKKTLKTAQESLNFLNGILFRKGFLEIIGNEGWLTRGGSIPQYDQQPVDAASMVFACQAAYAATKINEYKQLAIQAHQWYYGVNVNRLPLYDPASGGCYDALTPGGVNLNQGAESALSLILSTMSMQGLLDKMPEEEVNLASG